MTASRTDEAGQSDFTTTELTSEDLDLYQVNSLAEISLLTPNLFFSSSDSGGYGDIVTMRGSANTLFFGAPAVALYIDDVPYSDAYLYPTELLRLDSARIYHGPQGTAFGRNAPAGLIEVTTLQPTSQWRYGGNIEYGSYEWKGLTAYSAGPIAGDFSHSFQFYYRDRNGFIANTFLGENTDFRNVVGGLGSLVWTPRDDLEVKLRFGAERVRDGSQRITALPNNPNPFAETGDPFLVASNIRGRNDIDRYQVSLHLTKEFDWGLSKSITSYQDWDLGPQLTDLDLGPSLVPFTNALSDINQDQRLWTHEFRFESLPDSGPLSWRGGFFWTDKRTRGDAFRQFPVVFDPLQPPVELAIEDTNFEIDETNLALFGRASYEFANRVGVEAGGRLDYYDSSIDRRKSVMSNFLPPGVPISESSNALYFSPTVGVNYAICDDASVFLRSGLGIKPQGYTAFTDDPSLARFGEERNWSNEIGLQHAFPEYNANLVLRGYYNLIDDYQLNVQSPFATDFIVVNADQVRSGGIELEGQWRPVEQLLLHGSFGWNSSTFEDFSDPFTGQNFDGNRVPYVPQMTGAAGFRYDLPKGFFVASTIRASGKTYYDAANDSDFEQGAYVVWDAQAGYQAEHWGVTIFGQNLTDEEYYTFINPQIAAGAPGSPQVFGVRVNLDLW